MGVATVNRQERKCTLALIDPSTTLWWTGVTSTNGTKCHLSGRGMSVANVEQKHVIPCPGNVGVGTPQSRAEWSLIRAKKDLRKKRRSWTSQCGLKDLAKMLSGYCVPIGIY